MKILALDASGIVATVALASEEEIIAEYTIKHKKTHSQTLLPMIDEVMRFVELDINDVEYIAVTEGPGSFTGLRIGAATAKGLAMAYNIPIVSIPTLEALAYNINFTDILICPIMDARRNNVFTAVYRRHGDNLEKVIEQSAISIEELVDKINGLGQDVIYVGDGIKVHQEYIQKNSLVNFEFAPVYMREQKASSIVGLAFEYIKQGEYVSSKDMQLNYLRKSQAERELEEKLQGK